jgi:hypothetical protein
VRLQFKGKTPAWAYVLAVLFMIDIFLQIASTYWIPHWAPVHADPAHVYPIHFRGGPTYFVQPWLGAYFNYGFYAGFVLIGLFLLLLLLNRGKVERIR